MHYIGPVEVLSPNGLVLGSFEVSLEARAQPTGGVHWFGHLRAYELDPPPLGEHGRLILRFFEGEEATVHVVSRPTHRGAEIAIEGDGDAPAVLRHDASAGHQAP